MAPKVKKTARRVSEQPESPTKADKETRLARKPRTFKPVVHKLRPAVIQEEWTRLSDDAREEVLKILQAASVAVANSIGGDQKKRRAQETMDAVNKKMERRLRRLPVPPGSNDANFQYDKVLETNASLEGELVGRLVQVSELEAAVAFEETELRRDREFLEKLRQNAKQHEMQRVSQQKKMNKMLKDPAEAESEVVDAEAINLVADDDEIDPQLAEDKDVADVVARLTRHLATMSGSAAGLEELLAGTRRVAAALRSAKLVD